MTYGHELRQGNTGGLGVQGRGGQRGGKILDKCNSIINKIYFKKETESHKEEPKETLKLRKKLTEIRG